MFLEVYLTGAFFSPATWTALGDQTRATLLVLYGQAVTRLPAAVAGGIILILTSYAARIASRSADALGRRMLRSASLQILFTKSAALGVWMIGVLVASLLIFPGLRLGDIVATLGLGSVAVGFAFQDIFKNFLAGILLLVNEPFRIGDVIVVDKYEGFVEHIELRTTNVRTYAGEMVLIPNSLVFTAAVQVRTAFEHRRGEILVGVAYDTDLPAAIALAGATVAALDGVLAKPPVAVDATSFNDSSIELQVKYWSDSSPGSIARTHTSAVLALKAAFESANIEIPFPTTSLYMRGEPGTGPAGNARVDQRVRARGPEDARAS
jgi:small conductance mechanosensitive channel